MKLKQLASAGLSLALLTSQLGSVAVMAEAIPAIPAPPETVQSEPVSPPPAAETPPPVEEAPPPAVEPPPPVVETPPPAVETPPPAVETPPPASSTPPPAESTPPPASSTLPPAESTPPPASSSAPPAESTPPPASSSTPPAESALPPASSSTPSDSESESSPTGEEPDADKDAAEKEETDEEKAEREKLEAEKLEAEKKAALEKAEAEKKKNEKVLMMSASLDGDLASVGGGIIEYYGEGEPHIEIYTQSSSRTYGDAYTPNGIIFRVYGINEGQISMADFAAATYSIVSTDGTPQNIHTPVGKYNIYCNTSLSGITIGGKPIPVNFGVGYASGEVNVNKRSVTIAADSKQKTYGEADPGLTYTVSSGSIVPGDILLGELFREKAGPATEGVGVYDIKSTLSNTNYVITYVPAKLEIVRANLSISASTPLGRNATVEYGAIAPEVSFTISGLKNNDTVNNAGGGNNLGTVSVSCTAANDSVPGNYPITVSGLGTSLANYNVSYTNGNIQINRRTVMVAANGYTKTYGETDKALTATATAPNAATPSAPDTSDSGAAMFPLKYTLSRAAGETVGRYPISIEVDAATRQYYDVRYTAADVVISAVVLTVTTNATTREYGDPNPVFSVSYSGFVNGENESVLGGKLSYSTSAVRESGIGKYPVMPSGLTSGNYTIQFVAGDLIIEKRNVEAHMVTTGKVYGEADGPMAYTLPEAVIDPVNSPLVGVPYRIPGENVGSYKMGANFPNPNYKVYVVSANFTIAPAPLVATVNNATRQYGDANPTFSVRYDGFKRGDTAAVVTGTPMFTTIANAKSPVGNYPVAITGGLSARNYTISFEPGNLSVTKRLLTVMLDDKTQVYGAAEQPLTYTLSEPLIDPVGSPLTISIQREPGTGVGKYAITGTATNPNYTITVKDAMYNITAADLVVRVNDAVRKYGDENPKFTVSYEGLQLGDAADALTGELLFSTAATRTSPVDDYPVTVSGLASGNYNIEFTPGTLTVEQRALTVTLEDKTQVYGAEEKPLTYALNEPLVDPVGSPLTVSMQREPGVDVGKYPITGTFENSNYVITVDKGIYDITPAALKIAVEDATRKYGDVNPDFKVTYDGLQLGDDPASLNGTLKFTTAAEQKSPVADYTVSASGLSSKNYTVTFADGNLSVTQRPLQVSIEDKTQVYGAAAQELTYTLSENLIDPVGSPLSVSMQREPGTGVGKYAITGSFVNPNYAIGVDDGVYSITAADLVVRVNDASRVYGGENPLFTVSYEGLQLTDGPESLGGTLQFSTDAVRTSSVGGYPVTASGLTSGNYTITFEPGTLTVDQRPLVISADNKTVEYGETELPLTYTLSEPLVDPDGSPLVGELTREAGRDVDTYPITGEFTNGNYDIHFVPGVYTITPAQLTVKTDEASRKYGEENPDFTATGTGLKYEDTLDTLGGKLEFSTDAERISPVGEYVVTVTGVSSKNYTITFEDSNLSVTQRPLQVSIEDKTQMYGAAAQELTYTLSETLIDPVGSPLSVSMQREPGTGVGKYAITGSFVNPNYAIGVDDGVYSITAANLVVRVNDASRVYGGENPLFTAAYEGLQLSDTPESLDGTLQFDTDAVRTSSVGDYTVTASGVTSGNYTITFVEGTLTIDQRPLVISADDKTVEYGETELPLTYTLSEPLVDPDGSPLVGELIREAGRDADIYPITGEFVNGNYDIHFVPGVYTITPAQLTVKTDEASRKYGDENPDFTATGTGLKYEDILETLDGKLEFNTDAERTSDVGKYIVTVDGVNSKNYTITFEDGTLAIDPRPITVTADSKKQEYGEKEVELTYTLSEKEVDPDANPLVVTLTTPDGKDANAYIITVTVEDNKNYLVTPVPGIYIITPAPLVITVKDAEREHGAENPKFDVIYDGFKNNEDSTVLEGDLTFTTNATPGSDGGKYTVNVDGLKGKNYTITFVSGTLTVQNPPAQPAPEPEPAPTPVPEKPKKPVSGNPTSGNPTTGNDFFETYPLAAPLAGLLTASSAIGAWMLGKKRKKAKSETDESEAE